MISTARIFVIASAVLSFTVQPHALPIPDVTTVYLVPSDRTFNPQYQAAIANALLDLRSWYAGQLGGRTFTLHTPIVQSFTTPHPTSYYATHPLGDFTVWFFNNVVGDGFALTGGEFNDPEHRWIYYIDADPAAGQIGGGGVAGVAELPAQDLRGLTGQEPTPVSRWIGGLGHELGHAFGLPHPSSCEPISTSACPIDALMWLGYTIYPNTFLLPEDKAFLLSSPFFNTTLSAPEPRSILLLASGLAGFVFIWRKRAERN